MNYEEDNKKINVKLILLIFLIVIIIGFVVFLIFRNKSQKLLLDCSSSFSLEEYELDMSAKTYKYDEEYELILNYNMKNTEDLKVIVDLSSYKEIEKVIGDNLKKRINVPEKYFDYSMNIEDSSVQYTLTLHIDKDSEAAYTSALGINFLDSSKEDLIDYFKKAGMKCE